MWGESHWGLVVDVPLWGEEAGGWQTGAGRRWQALGLSAQVWVWDTEEPP